MPPPMKNGRIAVQIGWIDGTGQKPVTSHKASAAAATTASAAQPRNRLRMNLPAAWGVYQSKPRRDPSNHGGQQQRPARRH